MGPHTVFFGTYHVKEKTDHNWYWATDSSIWRAISLKSWALRSVWRTLAAACVLACLIEVIAAANCSMPLDC